MVCRLRRYARRPARAIDRGSEALWTKASGLLQACINQCFSAIFSPSGECGASYYIRQVRRTAALFSADLAQLLEQSLSPNDTHY